MCSVPFAASLEALNKRENFVEVFAFFESAKLRVLWPFGQLLGHQPQAATCTFSLGRKTESFSSYSCCIDLNCLHLKVRLLSLPTPLAPTPLIFC